MRRAVALTMILLASLARAAGAQQPVTWTGGVVGGGWDAITHGLAELIHEKTDLVVNVVPGGAAQNPALVEKGDAQIGMGMPPLLAAAARGEEPYVGRSMPGLRALAGNMSVNVFHFHVASDLSLAGLSMDEIFRTRRPVRLAISRPGTADVWVLEKIHGLCEPARAADCYKRWETIRRRSICAWACRSIPARSVTTARRAGFRSRTAKIPSSTAHRRPDQTRGRRRGARCERCSRGSSCSGPAPPTPAALR